MPSPIGHALAGLAIGLAGEPPASKSAARPSMLSTYGLLAATVAVAPDLDLFVHDFHRSITHSFGVTALVMIVAAVVTRWVTGRIGWRWVFVLGAAHASHIVLDWLGTDRFSPAGIEALWPVGHDFYLSGWEFFPPTERDLMNPAILAIDTRAVLFELATLGPFVVAAVFARRRRRSRDRTSGRASLPQPSA